MFGNPETTPGGRALKFFASVRIDIRRIGQIKDSAGKVMGNRTRVKIVKNKVAPPYNECEFDIMYNEGISRPGSIIDLGLEHKILEKRGSWISYNGNLIGQGREAAKQQLADNDALAQELTKLIFEKVASSGGIAGGMALAEGTSGSGDDEALPADSE
jgi:recombination protein RecA